MCLAGCFEFLFPRGRVPSNEIVRPRGITDEERRLLEDALLQIAIEESKQPHGTPLSTASTNQPPINSYGTPLHGTSTVSRRSLFSVLSSPSMRWNAAQSIAHPNHEDTRNFEAPDGNVPIFGAQVPVEQDGKSMASVRSMFHLILVAVESNDGTVDFEIARPDRLLQAGDKIWFGLGGKPRHDSPLLVPAGITQASVDGLRRFLTPGGSSEDFRLDGLEIGELPVKKVRIEQLSLPSYPGSLDPDRLHAKGITICGVHLSAEDVNFYPRQAFSYQDTVMIPPPMMRVFIKALKEQQFG